MKVILNSLIQLKLLNLYFNIMEEMFKMKNRKL